MPLKKCQSGGKSGWKYGDSGKCFTGPDAKKKAEEQAAAIHASGYTEKSLEIAKDVVDNHLKNHRET